MSDYVRKKCVRFKIPQNIIDEFKELYKDWHNEEYYQICYFNLLEKYKCGGISENEWQKIIER